MLNKIFTLSTNHVEIPNIVEEIIVQENNVDDLAEAIQILYISRDSFKEMSNKNRKIAEEKFSNRNVDSIVKIYRQKMKTK
jgi:glycosyltransferase involved in cell wall biosynthesis